MSYEERTPSELMLIEAVHRLQSEGFRAWYVWESREGVEDGPGEPDRVLTARVSTPSVTAPVTLSEVTADAALGSIAEAVALLRPEGM